MKFSFKQLTKKGLAIVLTLCVVLASFTFAFTVLAETAPYQVKFISPAIPMVMGTQISLADIEVQLEEGGEYCSGSSLTVSNVGEGLRYDEAAGTLAVFAKGVYPLTISNDTLTKEIYVVARGVADTEFVIYSEEFEDYTDALAAGDVNFPDGWVSWYRGGDGWHQITNMPGYSGEGNDPTTGPGIVPFPNTGSWGARGFFVLDNAIVNAFANYKITAQMVGYNHTNANYSSNNFGIIGRMNLTDSKPTSTSGATVLGLSGLRSEANILELDASGVKTTVLATGITATNLNSQTESVTITATYDGADVTVAANGMTDSYSTTTQNTQKGSVGFGCGNIGDSNKTSFINARSIKVALVNEANDMPESEKLEPAPEEPKPTINITGEGTAEVEAVVGAENTYTVEIIPAEGYKVKVLSLVIDGETAINNYDNETGLRYTFTSNDLASSVISVEFIPDDGTFNTAMVGASVKRETSGIRFGARTDFIKRSTTNEAVGVLDNRLLVDGTVYEPVEIGMLLIPSALAKDGLTVDTPNVAKQKVSKVVKLTDTFADIAITLKSIPEKNYGVKISSRMYVAYMVDGEMRYVYSNIIERSYNDVLAAIGK